MTRYRDKLTGRFVSRSTWKRSKAQGGTGYKKEHPRKQRKLVSAPLPVKPRKGRQRKPKIPPAPAIPQNREYFVVLLFRTRKHGKDVDRRLKEVIITAPDGASEDEIKKLYADWLKDNTNYTMQSIYNLVWAPNAGRRVEIRIIPRDEPTAEPSGTVKPNDARNANKTRAANTIRSRNSKRNPKRKRRKAK